MPEISRVIVYWVVWIDAYQRREKKIARLRDIAASPYFVLRCTMGHMKRIVMASSTLAPWKIITAFNDATEIWYRRNLNPGPVRKRLTDGILSLPSPPCALVVLSNRYTELGKVRFFLRVGGRGGLGTSEGRVISESVIVFLLLSFCTLSVIICSPLVVSHFNVS